MEDRTRGKQSGAFRWLGALVAIAASLALNVSPAAAVNGVGGASARGTDPEATLGAGTVAAQFSAITNCDPAQSTRPFYVRWTEGSTSFLFKKTSTDTSICFSNVPSGVTGYNANRGSGAGMVNGTPATVQWRFADGSQVLQPDIVLIDVFFLGNDLAIDGVPPQPLNGTPGGVWVFGDLPWPAM